MFIFAGGVIDMVSVAGSISSSVSNSVLSLEAVLFQSLLEMLELSNDTGPSNCSSYLHLEYLSLYMVLGSQNIESVVDGH